jgi:MFS family permease
VPRAAPLTRNNGQGPMKVTPDAVSDAPRSAGPPPLGRLGLVVTLGAALVVVLDFSIVNVALPALSGEMGVSTVTAGWVVTAYALTFGGLLVIGGRASDIFGRPRLLVAGLVVFAVASAAGGVAVDFPPAGRGAGDPGRMRAGEPGAARGVPARRAAQPATGGAAVDLSASHPCRG